MFLLREGWLERRFFLSEALDSWIKKKLLNELGFGST